MIYCLQESYKKFILSLLFLSIFCICIIYINVVNLNLKTVFVSHNKFIFQLTHYFKNKALNYYLKCNLRRQIYTFMKDVRTICETFYLKNYAMRNNNPSKN